MAQEVCQVATTKVLVEEHHGWADMKQAPVVEEEGPREVQVAARTTTQKFMMEVMVGKAILPLRVEAGVEARRRAGDLGPDQRVALLAAAMEQVLVEEQGISAELMQAQQEVQVPAAAMTQMREVTAAVEALLSVQV